MRCLETRVQSTLGLADDGFFVLGKNTPFLQPQTVPSTRMDVLDRPVSPGATTLRNAQVCAAEKPY
jgi:hypothetical protein